jgi:hypothetical protein
VRALTGLPLPETPKAVILAPHPTPIGGMSAKELSRSALMSGARLPAAALHSPWGSERIGRSRAGGMKARPTASARSFCLRGSGAVFGSILDPVSQLWYGAMIAQQNEYGRETWWLINLIAR